MSDMDEGDTPYRDKSCRKCGLVESPILHWEAESTGKCPACRAPWPACLEKHTPYDGKDRPRRVVSTTAYHNLPGGQRLTIRFDKGWVVASRDSAYSKEGWAEAQAVEFARRCELFQAPPGSLGKAEEEAERRAPAFQLVRDDPYKAATLLQDAMDNDETEVGYDPDVLVEALSTREWHSSNARVIETLILRAFCEAVMVRYRARKGVS